jgi:hypothetical protein
MSSKAKFISWDGPFKCSKLGTRYRTSLCRRRRNFFYNLYNIYCRRWRIKFHTCFTLKKYFVCVPYLLYNLNDFCTCAWLGGCSYLLFIEIVFLCRRRRETRCPSTRSSPWRPGRLVSQKRSHYTYYLNLKLVLSWLFYHCSRAHM